MPVPGPRTQFGPLPGYRNPEHAAPTLFNHWLRPGPIVELGRSPIVQWINLRGNVLARGQIRYLWRQSVNFVGAQPSVSWTANAQPVQSPPGVGITRALRYMTRSVYEGSGIDNSRYLGAHSVINPRHRRSAESVGRRVTAAAGSTRAHPTVRNRLTSFGARVPILNPPLDSEDY